MTKAAFISRLLLAPLLCWAFAGASSAQEPAAAEPLHVVKSSINAEGDNGEMCLEFDRPIATASPARLAATLKLESDGKTVTPQNISAVASSLCLFPLERDKPYRLTLAGLRGAADEKMAAPYIMTFTIPDRSPMLAFTGRNGGVNGFGSYDDPLTLRAVNVAHAKITVYRITDAPAMARAWQDRAQTALAPSESAYLAQSKGQQIWQSETGFDGAPNATDEKKMSLHDRLPDLVPGLYLIVADSNTNTVKPASKGLAPLTAAWFTKSDFSLRAVGDSEGIHVFAASNANPGPKANVHLAAMNRSKQEQVSEASGDAAGLGIIPYPPNIDKNDIATIIGTDAAGNVAFADIGALPPLVRMPALGAIHGDDLFAVPGEATGISLALTSPENAPRLTAASLLHLSRGDAGYADYPVAPPAGSSASLSFPAPALQAPWALRWQKNDGGVLAESVLRVTANGDAPHLDMNSEREAVSEDSPLNVTIKSVASSGKPVPLAAGHVTLSWQRLDAAAAGWKDYRFGTPNTIMPAPVAVADFLTDLQGVAQLRLTLPKPPQDPGLYQAVLTTVADADSGIADAKPLILPLRAEATTVGIKPLATDARFTQNGIARFALIGLSSDGKPRDMSSLSYQIFEEGRSFAWYQDEGRWKYKPEPQLRPIGGGALTIRADGGSVLEWPVTAGNYRLEILDSGGKPLAQTTFSAGWDSAGPAPAPTAPVSVILPKLLQPGHEAVAHILLPQAAMLTAIIADTRIRKTVHEFRPKGDNTINFIPAADWQNGVSLSVEALPQDGVLPLHGEAEATLTQDSTAAPSAGETGATIVATDEPSALALRVGGSATLAFAIENKGSESETYRYAFAASPGLKIENGDKGSVTLGGRQSRALNVTVSGIDAGAKEIRLEITGTHTPHLARAWPLAVLAQDNFLRGGETVAVAPQAPLIAAAKPREATMAFISRRPMDGLAEILSYVFSVHPFTTSELALSIDAMRLWSGTLAQTGFAPDFMIAAKQQEWLEQLLRHQNPDGGFGGARGDDSDMDNTAAALTALGPDTSALAVPARQLAIGWIKQRLSNTWFDEKERDSRAAAYGALAAADAIDPASLHYFSDTSAHGQMSAIGDAHIAAAFKRIRDPNAAAFWIKKMLDENHGVKTIPLLGALAATDALSSDDVHAAMSEMTGFLRNSTAPGIANAANLLRAISVDNADAGDWRLEIQGQARGASGVMAVRLNDPVAAALRNADTQNLFVTFAAADQRPPSDQPPGATISRHVYRLNGVELSPQARPAAGEAYLVELKGNAPETADNEQILIHDGTNSPLRPLTCPLTAKMDVSSFMPWFSSHDLTPALNCEILPHEMNAIIDPAEGNGAFRIVYFATIDAKSVGEIAPPRLRILK